MNELVKPTLKVDLDVKLPKIPPIEHNLGVIETYANSLIEFYEKLVFTPDQYAEAKDERTKINKLLKKMADNRKETIKEYKEPIEDFENTSKRIEKALEKAAGIIGASIEKFDLAEQEKKRVLINNQIEEIRKDFIKDYEEYSKELNELVIEFDKRWFNKTYKDNDLANDIIGQFNEKIDDLDTIKSEINTLTMFYNNLDKTNVLNKDVYIERYKNTRDISKVMSDMENDYKKANETKKSVPIAANVDPFAGLSVKDEPVESTHSITFKCYDGEYKIILDYMNKMGIEIMEVK